jgi:hypothetical protein
LTGHDPDFHSKIPRRRESARTGPNFVTGGTFDDARIATPGGHRIGEAGLGTLGLTLGTNYDRVNGAEFASVDLSNYTAIAVASAFGGLLTRAELDALIARSDDIADYVNAGGGLLALAECFPCGANLLAGATAPTCSGFSPSTCPP